MTMADKKTVTIQVKKEKEETVDDIKGLDGKKNKFKDGTVFRIITGSYEHNLLCLSLAVYQGTEIFSQIFHFTAHTQSIRCLASSKRYLCSGSNDEHIRIYDLQKRKELGTLLHHDGSITDLEFYGGKWLLSAANDGKICIWRIKDWEMLSELKGHKGAINGISVHPSGKIAISVGDDKTLRLWNLMTGRKASVLKLREPALKVKWTPDGEYFVVGFSTKLVLYSQSVDVVNEIPFSSPLHHLDVLKLGDNDEEVYIVTSHGNGQILFSNLSDVLSGTEKSSKDFQLVGHGTRVKHFSHYYHSDNGTHYLSSVSSDGQLVIWNLGIKDQVAVYNTGDRLNCCLLLPEEIEKTSTMKKRKLESVMSDVDTDFSEVESEVEQVDKVKIKKKQKKQKKKSEVTVEIKTAE